MVRLDAVIPDGEPLEVNRDKLQTMLSQACEGFTRNMGGPEVTGHCVSWFMNPIMNRVPDFPKFPEVPKVFRKVPVPPAPGPKSARRWLTPSRLFRPFTPLQVVVLAGLLLLIGYLLGIQQKP